MAIDAKFFSYDRNAVFQLANVEPGKAHAWTDIGIGRVVVAHCYTHDLGGGVHIVDEALVEITPQSQAYELIDEGTLECELQPGLSFEIDIVDHEGENGRLVLQHILPDGTQNSLN